MGNRSSRHRAKQQKNCSRSAASPAAAAALPANGPPAAPTRSPEDEHAGASAQKEPIRDNEQAPDGRKIKESPAISNQAGEEGGGDHEGDEEEDEDPLQFFRRLSNLSNSEPEGERESQDLFMSYTQALLLKEAGDYAAARCEPCRAKAARLELDRAR